MEPSIKPELLIQTLNFHGQQLQKVWEAERGETDLAKLNVDVKSLNFGVYQQRQKHLSFQDRGKRLKLQQFIVKKASALFDTSLMDGHNMSHERSNCEDEYYAVMPPYESFLDVDKQSKTRRFFESVKQGDIVICSIQSKSVSGMMLKVLCSDGEVPRYLADLNVKALCPVANIIPAVDKNSVPRNYLINDTVCCEVLEVIADTDKLVVGMKGVTLEPGSYHASRLGLIQSEDFPLIYKKAQEMKGETYETHLERSLGFTNPNNTVYLSDALGIGQTYFSNVQGMRGRFSEQEYATELRQVQASKWAFKNVAEGIEHFKSGKCSEAFGCLNKALRIDPRNVEGLVARGALYANSGSFHKAIADFETSLKLNQNHQNARKYMGETLVALGRSFEDENKFDDALKSYESCLAIIPFHEEAQNSIEFLKAKINSKLNDVEGSLPGLSSSKTLEVKETLKQLLKVDDGDDKKDKDKDRSRSKKKKDRKSRKRRRRSSTSSSSSSSGSSHSSSSSSSSSSDSSSGSSHSGSASPSRSRKNKKHKKKEKKEKKDKSLSPLSKRMALMDPSNVEGLTGLLAQSLSHYNPPALPYAFTRSAAAYPEPEGKALEKDNDYEQRVCRFLEQTKGDSEYEEKVRKFLEETARWKKERKAIEEKTSKKKKRKEKKSRDKEKSKKKRDHDKKKKHKGKKGDKFDAKDFDDQMESKKFRDALRKELSAKEEFRKRKGVDDDEEFLYGHGGEKKDFRSMLGLENLPDLEDLESKLSAYYAKVEKGTGLAKGPGRNEDRPDKKRYLSPKVMYLPDDADGKGPLHGREKKKNVDMFADAANMMHEGKNKFSGSESVALMNAKWKMQIGPVGSKIKKREKSKFEPWEEVDDKFISTREEDNPVDSDEELQKKRKKVLEEKVQARRAAMLEASEKRNLEKQKKEEVKRDDFNNKSTAFAGKFQGGFRSVSAKVLDKKEDLPPLPPGMPPKIQFPLRAKPGTAADLKGLRGDNDNLQADGDKKKDDKKRRGSRSSQSRSPSPSRGKFSRRSSSSHSHKSGSFERRRSRSGSYVRGASRSRSRSYQRYRSSGSRSRSRSYRSRSRSFNSRSRSRSEDGHYRRRSRSHSDDRRRRDYHMNKYQGRYPRNRGTYYRPRFQNYKNPRGFVPRGGRNFHPKFMHGRGRPFVHRGRGRGGGQRFFYPKRGGYNNKDYHNRDRRYDRQRSRDSDDRRSYSREEEDPMKKVDAAKEKINKYLADEEKKDAPTKRSKDDPLSEGEERDEEDYAQGSGQGFVDRKVYEGKWAEKDAEEQGGSKANDGALQLPENSIEEMDKFLTKVKAQKKEEMKERNKSFVKTNPW